MLLAGIRGTWRSVTSRAATGGHLLYSNEYEKRRNDTTANGFKGLDPRIVPDIVKRAHDAKLRVAAHIENAHDFRAAVAAVVATQPPRPAARRPRCVRTRSTPPISER